MRVRQGRCPVTWEEEHERAMSDPRVRGEETDAAPSSEHKSSREDELAEETSASIHGEFPPDIRGSEIGGGLEDQEALDAEYRGS